MAGALSGRQHARMRCCADEDTEAVIFAVYGDWVGVEPLLPAVVTDISRRFRPDDPSVCVWVDPTRPFVLRISVDIEAVDFDTAIRAGRAALDEAVAPAALKGSPVQVVAMTEQAQVGWCA